MPEKVRIIRSLCKGCGYCVEFCPNNVFETTTELNEKGATVPRIKNSEKCTQCGLCVLLCPDFAITMDSETT